MSSSHSSSTSPTRRRTHRRSKSASRASRERSASRERRIVRNAINAFSRLERPHFSKGLFNNNSDSSNNEEELNRLYNNEMTELQKKILRQDRRAKKGANRMTRQLRTHETRVDNYIRPVVTIILEKLHDISTIIFALYTSQYNGWNERDIPTLEKVKQTLQDALHLLVYYPKQRYPKIHNSSQHATIITNEEYKDVYEFYTPIKEIIKTQILTCLKEGSRLRVELLLEVLYIFPPHKREINFKRTNGSILYDALQ